jgi:lysophospholipase L1-like esterase
MRSSRVATPLLLAALLTLSTAAAAQVREPGNFDPTTAPASAPGTRSARSAPPRSMAHSPRDDQGHWTPTDFSKANPALPTLIIAGDSTASTGDPEHRGWAAVLADFFDKSKLNVVNRAVGGRSFRTFYGEGKWKQIVDALKPGDFVIIEFGHNDGGGARAAKGRGDVPGTGDDTVDVTRPDGTTETVHSFGWYLRTFIRDVKAKGATPIVSTATVRNAWTGAQIERAMGKVQEWDKQVAAEEKALLIDHTTLAADAYEKIGQEGVAKYFNADRTHMTTEGALFNARLVIAGLKAASLPPLVDALNDKGKAIEPATTAPPTSNP